MKTFRRYENALGELYEGQPEKMHALQRVQRMLAPLAKPAGPASNAVPTADANERTWKLLEAGLKAHYGILKAVACFARCVSPLRSSGATPTARKNWWRG